MENLWLFILNSVLFGVALAMDAFSVSMANGLAEPRMPFRRAMLIAGTFCFYQIAMPLIGWFCVHTIEEAFKQLQPFIPWIALALLLLLGIKMIKEGVEANRNPEEAADTKLGLWMLTVQGIATSIDALSVGFTIAEYTFKEALVECLIIGVVTLIISLLGIAIGKRFGTKLAGKASIFGGIILILIGLEIVITSFI